MAKTNPPEYLIDSILYPSKVVKTGFLMEIVLTQDGQTYSGKIFEEGDRLLVRSSPQEAVEVPVADVLSRQQEQLSIMPALLEKTMSEPELVDLLAYLTTL